MGLWPDEVPFPFEDGTGSPVLDELVGGPAAALTAVALVVAPGARASGWGARAAAALASSWRGPRRVLLADLDLENPTLHETVGARNDEGVIDLLEYGLSAGRLMQPGGAGAYDFLPAGIFTPDAGAILRHEGWSRVLMEIAARRGTLLAWVPSDADGVEAVVERAGAVLVLADPGEGRGVVEQLPHPYAVLGILTPTGAAQAEAREVPGGAEPVVVAAAAEALGAGSMAADTSDAESAAARERPADVLDASALTVDTAPLLEPGESSLPDEPGHPSPDDQPKPQIDAAAAASEPTVHDVAGGVTDGGVGSGATEAAAVGSISVEPPDEEPPATVQPAAVSTAAPGDVAPPSADDTLSSDPAARDALSRELRERQRAARLAGASPASGVTGASGQAAIGTGAAAGQPASGEAPGEETPAEKAPGEKTPGEATAGEAAPGDASRDRVPPGEPDTTEASAAAAGTAAGAMSAAEAVRSLRGAEAAPRTPETAHPGAHHSGDVRPQARPRPGRPPRSRYRRPLAWTIWVVLLASLLAGAWHYLSGRLERVPEAAAPPPPAPAPAAPVEQNALPFVVAIEAHRELLVALNRVADLTEIEPGVLFHVEPLVREGTLFYHVMAGPVPDSTAALALRDTLIARGHKTGPTPTDVRATPLAFLIGDYGSRGAADEQREILRRLDIPGYVLRGTAADGAPLYRLYVGGFASEAEADVTRQMLRSAGIRDSLVTRTGSAAAADFIGTEGDSVTAGDSLATPTGSSNP